MLQLAEVRKAYKTAGFEQVALDDVSIAFRDSEFVAILGPSGSGKTTLLNIVGGLDHYDSGDLIIDGISTRNYRDHDWDAYRNNRIGFVFQSYNLIPHQSVLVNVELALTLSGVSKAERRKRATAALEEVGLGEHINKKPNQLSGGQMQRVAIARALINDPEIVLADEPTGALDSKTSVQIMGLLTEIAQNRLVIMVTHNPDLAAQYANRTVKLHDGRIQTDSNPFIPTVADVLGKDRKSRKTAMSFFTAIALSFTNLMTKKGRAIMTSFAGSIGIVGIAAILSLANGVNNYIMEVEEDLLTVYPLTIQSSSLDLTSLFSASVGSGTAGTADTVDTGEDGATVDEAELVIKEQKMVVNTFSSIGQNDLAALKSYFDEDGGGISQYVNAIEYSYNVTPQVFASDTSNGPFQVNPDILSNSMGLTQGGGFSQLMSFGGTTSVFNPLMEDLDMLKSQYDVVEGRWPESYTECVIVLGADGRVSDYLLYLMGLRDPQELETMVQQFQNEEEVTMPEELLEFSVAEVMEVNFKLVPATDFYVYDETYEVWTDKRSDEEYLKGLVDAGETLTIVGLLQPNPDAAATSLSTSSIYYPLSLTYHLMDQAAQTQIVQDQLANHEVNVFTGKTFAEEQESSGFAGFAMEDLMTINESAISGAFSVDSSQLNVDLSGVLDPAKLAASLPEMPSLDLDGFLAGARISVPSEALTSVTNTIMREYLIYAFENGMTTPEAIADGMPDYLDRPEIQEQLNEQVNAEIDVEGAQDELQQQLTIYMQMTMAGYMAVVMENMQQQIQVGMADAMQQLSANMAGAMRVDQSAFANAFEFNLGEEELSEVVMALLSGDSNTYDNNLRKLGYADRAKPSGIDLYPFDFESKQGAIDILTAYNQQKEAEGEEDKLITYTDLVGLIMTSVTTIVDMISYVLVAFVAISLVVSSIMIGVITYISVLERKKEIGILRAIGARKRDIGNVFNAETLIIGFTAGVLGIAITLLLSIPANAVVSASFGVANIAILPMTSALVLVGISMVLTFISGLIPSSAASRRDPVEALRSE
jgi:ABC-type lipoprotein export system ATPase subunit